MFHLVWSRALQRCVWAVLLLPLLSEAASRGFAQKPVAENAHARPLQLQLVQTLDGATAHTGDRVAAKVLEDWAGGECTLPAASLLHGVVSKVADGVHAAVSVAFNYQCPEKKPAPLVWLALLSPAAVHHQDRQGPVFQGYSFHNSLFGSAGNTFANHSDMSGRQNPSLPVYGDSSEESPDKPPATLKTGEVWKLPRLALQVGTVDEGGTTVRSSVGALKVPKGSVLVLEPESVAVLRSPVAVPLAISPLVGKTAAVALPPMLKPCRHPACMVVHLASTGGERMVPALTLSLQGMGYRRLHSGGMQELENGAAIAYLSPHTILFTYDPHVLVKRSQADRLEDWPHEVRGLIFDTESGALQRSMTWRVPDNRQYLWRVPGGGAIVHDENYLRWLNSAGDSIHSLPLSQQLLWFKYSPDGKHFMVATIHELHSARDHEDLVHADAAGPEEQADLEILDADLNVVDRGTASSRLMAPLLGDDVRLDLRRRARSDEWFLRAVSWKDGTVNEFARFHSTCMPHLQSLPNQLLAVDGCDDVHMGHWYTVFDHEGSPVLRSELGLHDLEPVGDADLQSGEFAVAVPQGNLETLRGTIFSGADLSHELVNVFDRSGASLASVDMRFPLPSIQPVAIAPGGASFAVIDGDEIEVYRLARTTISKK